MKVSIFNVVYGGVFNQKYCWQFASKAKHIAVLSVFERDINRLAYNTVHIKKPALGGFFREANNYKR